MSISEAEYKVNKLMTNDLMEAEYFISNLGVATRRSDDDDKFRGTTDIIRDIFTVCSNNPTITDDVSKFLAGNPTTSEESNES